MTTRTRSETVTFAHPFILEGFSEVAPAGDYVVETEEEEIDSVSVSAWRRLSTIMHVPAGSAMEYRAVDPEALRDALVRDGAQEGPTSQAANAKVWRDKARVNNASRLVRRKKF